MGDAVLSLVATTDLADPSSWLIVRTPPTCSGRILGRQA
jgi:hypothetical protein